MATQTWTAPKDPQEIKDFGVNWIDDIGSLNITASTWTLVTAAGLTVVSSNYNNSDTDENGDAAKTATVRLSGGTLNETAELLNHVTLSDGQEFEQTCKLKIRKK